MTEILSRSWLSVDAASPLLVAIVALLGAGAWRLGAKAARLRRVLRGALPGVVDDDGDGAAVSITIEQNYVARDGWANWREERRDTTARAFTLLCDDGSRVLISDGAGARLWWPLEDTEHVSATQRRRIARVAPGRRVVVGGIDVAPSDGGPFRSSARAATKRGDIVVMEPSLPAQLAEQAAHLERRRLYTLIAGVAIVGLLLAALAGGSPAVGVVIGVEPHATDTAVLLVQTPRGERRFEVWRELAPSLGTTVALRLGPWPTDVRLGARPALPVWLGLTAIVAALGVAVANFASGWRRRGRWDRWWERDCVDDMTNVL